MIQFLNAKIINSASQPVSKRVKYHAYTRIIRRVTYLLPVLVLSMMMIINPFVGALPGDYTWQRAGTTGINGDNSSWSSIASSADGTKLVAAASGGSIYTSTDSGVTWTERIAAGSRYWSSIASSADGAKLAAVGGGSIYTSSDSGATWTERTAAGLRQWLSVVSSADGTKLVAADAVGENGDGGYIYTSTDSGATWIERTAAGLHRWSSTASSADGIDLVATERAYFDDTAQTYIGSIYTSSDSGATWTERTAAGLHAWSSITSSADGTKLAVIETHYDDTAQTFVGSIYTSSDSGATWTERTAAGLQAWIFIATSSDATKLVATAEGSTTIYSSIDSGMTWAEQTTDSSKYAIATSANGTKLSAIGEGSIYTSLDSGVTWTRRIVVGSRVWYSIASSADGTKLVAGANGYTNAYIYTSSDSGATWIERTAAGSRHWYQTVSSASGAKLAALGNNSIYTSSDSGATWTEQTGAGTHYWSAIATSTDGTKLTAVTSSGSIYTSADSGVTWTERISDNPRQWYSIASSADGTKLAAVETHYDDIASAEVNSIYTSADSGVTWTEHTVEGLHQWRSIAMSSDGTKLAATETHYDDVTSADIGSVYTSTDSGVTWTERTTIEPGQYQPIASSSDGTTLAVAAFEGSIYISTDSGASWVRQAAVGVHAWSSLAMSSNGAKLAAAVNRGSIYLATMETEGAGGEEHTTDFRYDTLGSSEHIAVANAVLSATSTTCYSITNGSTTVLGPLGVNAPEAGVSIVGGIAYTLSCTAESGSANATITLGSYYGDLSRLRIYKKAANSNVLEDITSQVNLTNTTDSNQNPITTVSYTLTDGGAYDEDGLVNSTIVDPMYLGIATSGSGASANSTLANTGDNLWVIIASSASLLVIASGIVSTRLRVAIYR